LNQITVDLGIPGDSTGWDDALVPRKEAEGICQAIKACCDGYASDPDYPNEKILTGLKDFARRKDRLSETEKIIAVAHIAWLEKQGLMCADEFNGVDVVDLDAVTMTPFWKFVG
jgi:hypothetical protein